jgi:dipeptidase E
MINNSQNLFLASNISFTAAEIAKRYRKIPTNSKLLFIPTAAEPYGDDIAWLDLDREALKSAGFALDEFTVTGQDGKSIKKRLEGAGGVFLTGGNTYYLLMQIRKSGFDRVIRKYVEKGLIYLGSSAGSLVAGPTIETSLDVNRNAKLKDYSGLLLTHVSVRPHWGSDHFRDRYVEEMARLYNVRTNMVMLWDNQFLHVKDNWCQIITV